MFFNGKYEYLFFLKYFLALLIYIRILKNCIRENVAFFRMKRKKEEFLYGGNTVALVPTVSQFADSLVCVDVNKRDMKHLCSVFILALSEDAFNREAAKAASTEHGLEFSSGRLSHAEMHRRSSPPAFKGFRVLRRHHSVCGLERETLDASS